MGNLQSMVRLPVQTVSELKLLVERRTLLDAVLLALREDKKEYLAEMKQLEDIYKTSQSAETQSQALNRAQRLTTRFKTGIFEYKTITENI